MEIINPMINVGKNSYFGIGMNNVKSPKQNILSGSVFL